MKIVGGLQMKKFDMVLDKTNKELKVKVWGMNGPDDANSFISDFTKTASTIQASEFILCFDAEELKVSTMEMVPMLEGCFKM
jgi:hypothetical protein